MFPSLSVQLYKTFYGAPPESYLQRTLDRLESTKPTMLAPGHGAVLAGNLAPYYRAYRTLAGETRVARGTESTPPEPPLRKHAGW